MGCCCGTTSSFSMVVRHSTLHRAGPSRLRRRALANVAIPVILAGQSSSRCAPDFPAATVLHPYAGPRARHRGDMETSVKEQVRSGQLSGAQNDLRKSGLWAALIAVLLAAFYLGTSI